VDVEALLVVAVRPGDDMGGAQQRRIGDAGQRAPATPVILTTPCAASSSTIVRPAGFRWSGNLSTGTGSSTWTR